MLLHVAATAVAVAAVAVAVTADDFYKPPDPTIFFYDQQRDHNDTARGTFKQQVLLYDKYWTQAQSPKLVVFFGCGGESPVRGGYDHDGFIWEIAEQVGGLIVFPEHRFYGKSLPFGSAASYDKENVGLLTIEQAVEDYVTILRHVRKHYNVSSSVPTISFGGSYPGELASYMRIAYPGDYDAAYAASAPVLYHLGLEGAPTNNAFFVKTTEVFAIRHGECPDYVRGAMQRIFAQSASAAGRANVVANLRLCDEKMPVMEGGPLGGGGPNDWASMLSLWVSNAFATLSMENYPYESEGFKKWPLLSACTDMHSFVGTNGGNGNDDDVLVRALAIAMDYAYNMTNLPIPCFNITDEYAPCADLTGCGAANTPDAMSWDFASCTEIVSPVDTNNVTDMLPPSPYNFDKLKSYCAKRWYGAVPKPLLSSKIYPWYSQDRIVWSNGDYDGWSVGGIQPHTPGTPADTLVIIIPEAAHHLDLRGSSPQDPAAVIRARVKIRRQLLTWVEEATAERLARGRRA